MSRLHLTIALSLVANLGLAVVLLRWPAVPPAPLPAVALLQPTVALPPVPMSQPTTLVVPPAAPLADLAKLESGAWARLVVPGDLRGSILRLRAAGCPEQTLRDLALGQFQKRYQNGPWEEAVKKAYWKNPDHQSPEIRQWQRAQAAQARADGELSKELFGVDLLAEERSVEGFWEDRDASGNYLPAPKRDALRRFLEDFAEKEHQVELRNRGLLDAQWRAETAQLEA